ncbi:hypothetical protein QVD17_16233 [Tagetes erecta]|uniref:Uncharacterized protein n=1 Tax=Tagetes erecta TaxID=13708 RepID=A0AAD8P0I3_TARER|nr:hypothetical protein QVD17_16233 [Tagetes erecta]
MANFLTHVFLSLVDRDGDLSRITDEVKMQKRDVTGLQEQGGSEKLSDEAVKDTLMKVVKLLSYISDVDLFVEFYSKNGTVAINFIFMRNKDPSFGFVVL